MKLNKHQPAGGAINTGPFSPSIFSSKRLWIKRPSGSPTTILVHQNDIIDDVKLLIIEKYPNSLGREYDAADIVIKMEIQLKHPSQTTSNGSNKQRASFSSPEKNSTPTYATLEPDQNVWSILDTYFPNGMSIHNAFIIEEPGRSRLNSKNSIGSLNLPTVTALQVNPAGLSSQSNSVPSASPSSNTIPGRAGALSPQSTYHLPRPQYNYQQHQPYTGVKEQSISPSSVTLKSPSTVHRRSQSNPPQSPVTSLTSSIPKNPSSQAILLLPKNFSLTSAGSSGNLSGLRDQKRLSLDEGRMNRASSASILGSSLPSVGIGGVSSPPAVQASSYPLVQKGPSILSQISTEPKAEAGESSSEQSLTIEGAPPLGKASSLPAIPTTSNDNNDEDSADNEKTSRSEDEKPNMESDPEVAQKGDVAPVRPPVRAAPAPPVKRLNGKSIAMVQKLWKKNPTTNERMLPSVSVLVVEDNAINQAILGAFLRRHKISYQIAKNGQEAVDKWSKGGFHLVLMDIQLPVISGIEATKEIRRLEKINRIGVFAEDEMGLAKSTDLEEVKPEERLDLEIFRSPVIIVALTASSNSSVDKTNALRAGCNDYLTKPVNLVWLQKKITEWGCMQALIDFEGWKTKRQDEGTRALKSNGKGVVFPTVKLVASPT